MNAKVRIVENDDMEYRSLDVANEMRKDGLPFDFICKCLSKSSQSIYMQELMGSWHKERSSVKRIGIIESMKECLLDDKKLNFLDGGFKVGDKVRIKKGLNFRELLNTDIDIFLNDIEDNIVFEIIKKLGYSNEIKLNDFTGTVDGLKLDRYSYYYDISYTHMNFNVCLNHVSGDFLENFSENVSAIDIPWKQFIFPEQEFKAILENFTPIFNDINQMESQIDDLKFGLKYLRKGVESSITVFKEKVDELEKMVKSSMTK